MMYLNYIAIRLAENLTRDYITWFPDKHIALRS